MRRTAMRTGCWIRVRPKCRSVIGGSGWKRHGDGVILNISSLVSSCAPSAYIYIYMSKIHPSSSIVSKNTSQPPPEAHSKRPFAEKSSMETVASSPESNWLT